MKNLRLLDNNILRYYSAISAKKGKRLNVAVIGNSGIDQKDNKKINEADVVVRFNNYGTRAGIVHTADKLKCDILFSTFDLHSQGASPTDVVIGIPYPFKAKEIVKKPSLWYPNSRLWMVNPYDNMRLCEELELDSLGYQHPLPSIGLTAMWHMQTWSADFYIAGFKWYYDPETKRFQGHDTLKNKKYPSFWNHFYPKEVEWFLRKMRPKNNIIFSESCNKILDEAERQLK